MNNVEFRAWNKTKALMFFSKSLVYFFQDIDKALVYGDKIELMQFTDLFDRDGRKIFQGDIVQNFDFENPSFRFEVIKKNGAFGYETRERFIPFAQNGHFDWKYGISDRVLVIGNIYENPEVLHV